MKWITKYLNYDSYLIFKPRGRTQKKIQRKSYIIYKSKDFLFFQTLI